MSLKTDWLPAMSLPATLIKGSAPISGVYDLRAEKALSNYAPDPDRQGTASPPLHVDSAPPRNVVAVGSVEPFVAPARALVDKIRKKGSKAELVVLEGMAHDDTALALGDEDSKLVQAILAMIQRRAGAPSGR